MIECEHISLSYPPGHTVLRDISFHIQPGTFHFLSGASGAGKSSLLSLLCLLQTPTHGTLHLFGYDATRLPRSQLPVLRRRIGMVHQDFRLLDHLNVEDNVALPLKVAGEPERQIRQKVKELLAWVGLENYHRTMPATLSGGQKQRTAIARAVITKPDLLLADEPSGNLDPYLSLRFMYLFEALNASGTTILYATHDEHLISQFNYPVLHLNEGRLENVPRPQAA